eukprot:gnl/TRDRNA2_/TRDRNA2_45135_c0_seq1.p1 gnl/TRDRNA2_/TRDRNA2_45135_c0~~gnl/TRDRNA2_/TRDRNA2_45135_c0_seq1.p1  ORF type:complete len:388 (-),score=41.02 gnl/TRDRNA2_/TRDRNA2_45135_c0_seq1:206-1342(-)
MRVSENADIDFEASKAGSPFRTRGAFQAAAGAAFQAAARPLCPGAAVGRRPSGVPVDPAPCAASADLLSPSLAELAEGPYFIVGSMLDAAALCRADACCRLLRALNRAQVGPWRALGVRAFYGMELERDGVFELGERDDPGEPATGGGRKLARVDWKGRYGRFRTEVPTFRAPFCGAEISTVRHPDEVAYCRCQLRTDLLAEGLDGGVYLEVEVQVNPDNLSLAVVDFEAGGRSSVTFSPDTGAVIRERKVREAPRKVEGAYIQPLSTTPPGRRFEGSMGLYLHAGHLAFFRRCSTIVAGKTEMGPWESTGFVTDLRWAEGRRLTPCLAFRDEGAYRVHVARIGAIPPIPPGQMVTAYEDRNWSGLDWEAGQMTPPEV